MGQRLGQRQNIAWSTEYCRCPSRCPAAVPKTPVITQKRRSSSGTAAGQLNRRTGERILGQRPGQRHPPLGVPGSSQRQLMILKLSKETLSAPRAFDNRASRAIQLREVPRDPLDRGQDADFRAVPVPMPRTALGAWSKLRHDVVSVLGPRGWPRDRAVVVLRSAAAASFIARRCGSGRSLTVTCG